MLPPDIEMEGVQHVPEAIHGGPLPLTTGSEPSGPPCRVCGDLKWVACWRPEHPERAICVECCAGAEHHDGETGHVWTYDRAERDRVCDHCGQFARNTDYYAGGDDD